MPYPNTKSLPKPVKKRFRGQKRQRQYAHVFNSILARTGDERRAYAGAWSATKRSHAKKRRKAQRHVESVFTATCKLCNEIDRALGLPPQRRMRMLRTAVDRLAENVSRELGRTVDLWETSLGDSDRVVRQIRALPIDPKKKLSIVGHVLASTTL